MIDFKRTFSLFLLLFFHHFISGQSLIIDAVFYNKAASIFNKAVVNHSVDYKNIQANPNDLLELLIYVDNTSEEEIQKGTPKERLSFYSNAYNLTVIKAVVLNYPLNSPQEVMGFFETQKHLIADRYMTLNQLENEIIRPQFKDPRIHFALNCAAQGCPPLFNEAFEPFSVKIRHFFK